MAKQGEHEEYSVIIENEGCPNCSEGKSFTVIDRSTETCIGSSYGCEEDAESVCGWMNMAFNAGREYQKRIGGISKKPEGEGDGEAN